MIQNNKIVASAAEREATRLEWLADSLIKIDTAKSKVVLASITPEQRALINNLTAKYQTEVANAANDVLWGRLLDSELAFYEKAIPNPELLQIHVSKLLYQYLERTRTAMDPADFKRYLAKIGSPALQASVVAYQKHLLDVTKTDYAYAESLKNTDHLKESKDADSIFKALLEPYKGKVIYLDFWGTWCQPCREEMKFAGAVKDALKGKDVVFMYLANNSPEHSWKNIIKEMGLTSENTIHYRLAAEQQSLIERRLAIKGFPTYLLIDKEGNIVNSTPPRPSQRDELVTAVNALLK
jgi:thiol-disulfide isomerase/thioredoxin